MRILTVTAAILLETVAAANAGEPGYLFDTLKKPAFHKAWDAMLNGERNIPHWILAFSKGGSGVATPMESVTVEGAAYLSGTVCKQHDCGGHEAHVLFSAGGAKAFGLLTDTGKPERFLGAPGEALQRALKAGVSQ